jgi:hypothetical protein
MATTFHDPEAARLAALTALRGWALRRDRLPGDRAGLLAAAWHAGARNVRELARLADVSRDTVYADLKSRGVDPGDRASDRGHPPRYEPLRHEDVRDLADMASSVLISSMLTDDPGPLAAAAWQVQIALTRVAELLDPTPREGFDRAGTIEDLAARAAFVRQSAHRLLAGESVEALAARAEDHQVLVLGEQALVMSAQLRLELPNAGAIDVELATAEDTAPGWTTWRSPSPHLVGEVDGYAHLEITAALDAIGAVLTTALDEDALAERP